MFNAVKQFHFTCWPDHGVPGNTNGIMKFIKKSVAANILASAPIVVHCRYFAIYLLISVIVQLVIRRLSFLLIL